MQRQSMIGSCLLAQDVIYVTRSNVDEDPTKVSRGLKNNVVLDNIENIIVCIQIQINRDHLGNMSHSQMLGKFEYGGGPIFKVVIEC